MSLLTFICALGLAVGGCIAQHDHEDHADTFHEILEFFGATNEQLSYSQTNQLIRHMLYRVGCAELAVCTTCLNTTTVLQYVNRTTENTLNEAAFHKLSVILVVFMRDVDHECAGSEANLGPGGRTFPEFIELLVKDSHADHGGGDHEDHMDAHKLEDLFHDISERYKLGDLEVGDNGELIAGPTLNMTSPVQCITPETVFEELGLTPTGEIEGEALEDMAALVVAHILHGYCLSPEGLPPPHSFTVDIFMKYADKTTGLINPGNFEQMLTAVGIGGTGDHTEGDHDHAEDAHDHAVARKRRHVEVTASRRVKRAAETHHETDHGHEESFDVSKNCFSAEQLLKVFVENSSASVSPSMFETICPSIVQQLLASVCTSSTEEKTEKTSTTAEAYGYGTLAIFIITLCTLLGAVFASIKSSNVKRRLIAFMMSLAIGTLLGDPALHLIPAATGLHGHEGDDHDHAHGASTIEIEPYVWKMTALLASFYAFFLLELFMNKSSFKHSHSQDLEAPATNGISPNSTKHKEDEYEAERHGEPINKALIVMICAGDALHNFADGMAVGAAFALSVAGGISTSIAILCHELPHELGDFAALLASGLSVKKAMLMNFISGCTAFIGLYVGLSIGENTDGRTWIFIIAAGMFIYVALANLVPEVMGMLKKAKDTGVMLVCVNAGILLGFALMFVIAVFEEYIRI